MNACVRHGLMAIGLMGLLSSCTAGSQVQLSQPISADGSSTVYPITKTIVEDFQKKNPEASIQLNFSGTGGGFKKFCLGQTSINNASRPISEKELTACQQGSISFLEVPVAFDALTVVVHPKNDWANEMTVAELKKLWESAAQGKITRWNQVRSSWPNRPIKLVGPGKDSGTYDYFVESIIGQDGFSRSDYEASEDDEVLAELVSRDPNALGYFGLAYYQEHQSRLKAIAIDAGKGAILPNFQSVKNSTYQPLARPLFIYVNARQAQTNPVLGDFVKFYLQNAETTVPKVGYVPLPQEAYHIANVNFFSGKVGTVFEGQPQPNVTIGELMRKTERLTLK
ncbi:MAG: PstS family phosphate ABC transporter substrate-binding protein [Cyanobacteria bacterium LVE1205-1]|jgi:phosphate transport system substrate-binding protein